MKLLIAIPALNEEQSIQDTIQRCLAAKQRILETASINAVEITVVSDGSTDRTVARAKEFGGLINLIEFQENQGYGAAIMKAWSDSEAELLGFLDADGTCDPDFFATLCTQLLQKDADVALGSRLNKGSQMPWVRRIGNTLFAWLLSAFASETVRDAASGMRVVRRSALPHLYPLPVGLNFTPAMSARAMLSDAIRIIEVDMPYAKRAGESKLRPIRDGFRFLRVILENAVLYKSAWIFSFGAFLSFAVGLLLMLRPLIAYIQTQTVAEWMIYRFLVSALAGEVAELLIGAGLVSARITSIALHEEVRKRRTWIRTGWPWVGVAALLAAAGILVWPSAVQLWRTGHTDLHWSRFVVAMGFSFSATIFVVVWAIDFSLDFVEARVRHLWDQRQLGTE